MGLIDKFVEVVNSFFDKKENVKREVRPAFEEKDFDPSFRILFVADLHNKMNSDKVAELEKKMNDFPVNHIITLGDIGHNDWLLLEELRETFGVQMSGVLGNHDDFGDLVSHGVTPLQNSIEVRGTIIAGFGGSIKYKNVNYPSFTDEESVELANAIPEATIFVTHDRPKVQTNDLAHSGLRGISYYIKNKKPTYHFHGHIHQKSEQIIEQTRSISVCGFECWAFNSRGAIKLWEL
jgi:Icc-related predicted phosphoesterase